MPDDNSDLLKQAIRNSYEKKNPLEGGLPPNKTKPQGRGMIHQEMIERARQNEIDNKRIQETKEAALYAKTPQGQAAQRAQNEKFQDIVQEAKAGLSPKNKI